MAMLFGVKTGYCRGGYDYWLLKIDKAGSVLSDITIGGSGYDYLTSIDKTADGGLILGVIPHRIYQEKKQKTTVAAAVLMIMITG
jgi:hypothetical protein